MQSLVEQNKCKLFKWSNLWLNYYSLVVLIVFFFINFAVFWSQFNQQSSNYNLIIKQTASMTSKADIQQNYFHHFSKNLRTNNPTFASSFVNDSLTLFTPQKYNKQMYKASEYKSNFEPLADKINLLNFPHKYARISKQTFEKNSSHLSHYGSNSLSQSILTKK